MKNLVYPLIFFISLTVFPQDTEFTATIIGDKEAFLSSKTGEFVYREHAKTDVAALYTSETGDVIYENRKVHIVKKGETLSAIAKKHGISIADLKTQNKLKSVNLSIGQELKVILKQVVASSKPILNKPEGKIVARLAPGQMPGGMTPPDLPPDAMPGNSINLVTDDSNPQVKAVENKVTHTSEDVNDVTTKDIEEDGTLVHTVKRGETLYSIARKYKMSFKDLKDDNGLALNTLSVGQKLKVKVYNPAVLNQTPTIKAEETTPISQQSDAEIDDSDVETELGELVAEKLEGKKEAPVNVKKPETIEDDINEERTKALIKKYKKEKVSESEADSASIYVVKKGDTLWSIAKRLHISIKDLKDLNNLSSNELIIGQKLKIK